MVIITGQEKQLIPAVGNTNVRAQVLTPAIEQPPSGQLNSTLRLLYCIDYIIDNGMYFL